MQTEEIRKYFEYLRTGKIYFNHASVGPLPSNTVSAIKNYLTDRSENEINIYMKYYKADKSAKRKLAKIIGCSPERLAWTPNVGSSMSILAQGIKWNEGDRIILNNIEFPANVYPFLNLRTQGVEIDFVDASDGVPSVDKYEKLITPKTKLISVSLVQFLSGYKIDIEQLSALCKKHNIILSVDAIQAAGNTEIKAEDWGIDFLSGGTQKWLLGLEGLSYAYISKALQDRLDQKIVGWSSVKDAWELLDYNLEFLETAERFQTGTTNTAAVFAADSSLSLFIDYGLENVYANVFRNSKYLMQRLSGIGYKPVLLDQQEKHVAGIVTFDADNAERIKTELLKKNMVVEVRVGKVRVSPHFYNTFEEIDNVVEAIEELS